MMIGVVFTTEEVSAALAGTLTEIRRPVEPMRGEQSLWLTRAMIGAVPHGEIINGGWQMHHPKADTFVDGVWVEHDSPLGWIRCPLGVSGDLLRGKERWARVGDEGEGEPERVVYAADVEDLYADWTSMESAPSRWRSAVSMPLAASRLLYTNHGVRVEQVDGVWTWVVAVERMNRPDGTPMRPVEIWGAP